MRFYLDTEFIECAKQRRVLGVKVGTPVPTIDLISLALVAEDGRELYLLNADCELAYAWADKWVRKNVLYPIFREYYNGDALLHYTFSLSAMRGIFKRNGKSRRGLELAIGEFVGYHQYQIVGCSDGWRLEKDSGTPAPQFYADYSHYDWVVFCQIFGRMIQLPNGFPQYCIDLQQEMARLDAPDSIRPENNRQHNALADARANKILHTRLRAQYPHVA